MLLQAGVVLPLLDRVHLQLADGRLHVVDVFTQHGVLLFEICRLFPQLPQFRLDKYIAQYSYSTLDK